MRLFTVKPNTIHTLQENQEFTYADVAVNTKCNFAKKRKLRLAQIGEWFVWICFQKGEKNQPKQKFSPVGFKGTLLFLFLFFLDVFSCWFSNISKQIFSHWYIFDEIPSSILHFQFLPLHFFKKSFFSTLLSSAFQLQAAEKSYNRFLFLRK